jgi:small subunit ribosomal protein S1
VTDRLADVVGQVEEAVLAAGARVPGAADRMSSLRMLISMQLQAGALAGDEVDDDEATELRYLVTLLAHLRQHELGLRLLRDGADRAPLAATRARLGGLHGVLLAQLGRTGEARTRLEEALADAAGETAEAARIHAALAVLGGDGGTAETTLRWLGNAEALDRPGPAAAFANAFGRLRIALLREDTDAAAELGHTLDHAGDELIDSLPDQHPDAFAAVADLAYARFRVARLTGHPDRLGRPAAVLRTATRLLAATLGPDHPRTITAGVRRAECDRLLGAGSEAAVRELAAPELAAPELAAPELAAHELAARTARLFGADHPLTVMTAAEAALTDNSPAPGADAAARVLGRHHPLTVVLAAAARPEGDDLARVSAQAALVLGVGHSVTRMLDERLRTCRRTGLTAVPTHRTTDAIGTDTTAMSEPTAAATAATATASTDADLPTDAAVTPTAEGGATPSPAEVAGPGIAAPPDTGAAPDAAAPPDVAAAPDDAAAPDAPDVAAAPDVADSPGAVDAVAPDAGAAIGAGGSADADLDPAAAQASPGEVAPDDGPAAGADVAPAEASSDVEPAGEADTAPAVAEASTVESEPAATDADGVAAEPVAAETAADGGAGAGAATTGEPVDGDEAAKRSAAADERAQIWDAIEKLKDDGGVVRGRVVEVVKGGLVLDVGVRAFLPASLVEMRRVRDLQPYVGREIEAKVLEMDRGRGNLVLSRRARLEETRSVGRSTLLAQLEAGQIRKGVISSVVNFGAFVDLGGVDGLISVAELSWTHHNHPSDVVDVGQEVEVEVLDVDQARGRISLSLKATQQDPWPQFARNHPIGQIVSGRVTKLMPFGAFVRVDGLEGLVHVSELADYRVDTPDQVLRANQEVLVKVTDIDLQRRRISLSMRQANAEYLPDEEQFDPVTYGMLNTYDAQGNYIYPDGFDAATGEWLPGFEEQRDAWEGQYAEAHERWNALGRQVEAAQTAPAGGGVAYATGSPGGGRPERNERNTGHGPDRGDRDRGNAARTSAPEGSGAGEEIDERLAALRERLSDSHRSNNRRDG